MVTSFLLEGFGKTERERDRRLEREERSERDAVDSRDRFGVERGGRSLGGLGRLRLEASRGKGLGDGLGRL